MQRRHFELIASIIATLNPISPNANGYKEALIEHFADNLANTNKNFDRARFITACLTGNMGKGRSHKNVMKGQAIMTEETVTMPRYVTVEGTPYMRADLAHTLLTACEFARPNADNLTRCVLNAAINKAKGQATMDYRDYIIYLKLKSGLTLEIATQQTDSIIQNFMDSAELELLVVIDKTEVLIKKG